MSWKSSDSSLSPSWMKTKPILSKFLISGICSLSGRKAGPLSCAGILLLMRYLVGQSSTPFSLGGFKAGPWEPVNNMETRDGVFLRASVKLLKSVLVGDILEVKSVVLFWNVTGVFLVVWLIWTPSNTLLTRRKLPKSFMEPTGGLNNVKFLVVREPLSSRPKLGLGSVLLCILLAF